MDDTGIPNTWDKVLENAIALVEKLGDLGLDRSGIFLDVMIQPLSVDTNNGIQGLNSVEAIMEKFPGVHTTCGLSNISYGLPERFLVNRTFMVAAMARGLDSAILDPLDKKIMTLIRTAEMVLGRDEFCGEFIDAMREGKLES
jgi:cobalamin-dependent methionine synthase I